MCIQVCEDVLMCVHVCSGEELCAHVCACICVHVCMCHAWRTAVLGPFTYERLVWMGLGLKPFWNIVLGRPFLSLDFWWIGNLSNANIINSFKTHPWNSAGKWEQSYTRLQRSYGGTFLLSTQEIRSTQHLQRGSSRDLLFESGKGSTLYSWLLLSPPNSEGTKLATVFHH